MWRKIFDPDSYFWRPLGYVGELVVLSLLSVILVSSVKASAKADTQETNSSVVTTDAVG